jgi:hypothetical protein
MALDFVDCCVPQMSAVFKRAASVRGRLTVSELEEILKEAVA